MSETAARRATRSPATPIVLCVLVAVVAGVYVASDINGLAGFGFALVGTMALATVIAPRPDLGRLDIA